MHSFNAILYGTKSDLKSPVMLCRRSSRVSKLFTIRFQSTAQVQPTVRVPCVISVHTKERHRVEWQFTGSGSETGSGNVCPRGSVSIRFVANCADEARTSTWPVTAGFRDDDLIQRRTSNCALVVSESILKCDVQAGQQERLYRTCRQLRIRKGYLGITLKTLFQHYTKK